MHHLTLFVLCLTLVASCGEDGSTSALRDPSQEPVCKANVGPPTDCLIEDVIGEQNLKLNEYKDLIRLCETTCSRTASSYTIGVSVNDSKNLSPMRNLRRIESGLSIGVDHIKDLRDLDKLEYTATFRMESPSMEDLSALTGAEIGYLVQIRYSPALRSLRGLEGARDLTQYTNLNDPLTIEEVPGITDLKGLDGLVAVGKRGEGIGFIASNDGLTTLDGLQQLRRGAMLIRFNPKLRDISALYGFEQGDLSFVENRELPQCQIDKLRAAVAGRDVVITAKNNGPDDPSLCP
jgi:hypothetical protein